MPDAPDVRWTRRRFLSAAAWGAAGLFLQACRKSQPTTTPTPTSTLRPLRTPTVPSDASPTSGAVATGERVPTNAPPSRSPGPSPTDEPPPEPTPTPSATPFPPGNATKLGLFVGYNMPQLFDLLRTGNLAVVKTLEYDPNFVAEIKRISPSTLIIARYTPLPIPDLRDWRPVEAARQFVALLLPIATEPRRLANIDAWEAYNEPSVSSLEEMAGLAAFEAERTRLLAAEGVRSCVGNFSTGQPGLELWPAFYPALQAVHQHNGFLGLHEYAAPYIWFASGPHQLDPTGDEGDEGWLTLRYRKLYRDYLRPAGLDVPLVITEAGIDGQVGNRPGPAGRGWQDFTGFWVDEGQVSTTAEGYYIEQLAWYDAELYKDDYVEAAAVFTLAGPRGWESFEVQGTAAEILRQYLSVHPQR